MIKQLKYYPKIGSSSRELYYSGKRVDWRFYLRLFPGFSLWDKDHSQLFRFNYLSIGPSRGIERIYRNLRYFPYSMES